MLSLNELIAVAEAERVSVPTIERDYVLTHLIQRLSTIDRSRLLTFKGGTALRLVHFQGFRYSADIDLNINDPDGMSEGNVLDLLAEAARQVEADLGVSVALDDGKLTYTGPRNQARPEAVKLDIAADEVPTAEPHIGPLIIRYPDQQETVCLPSYGLEESASEKLRCVVQRLQCRDLYDIHRLLVGEGVDVEAAWHQYTKKVRHRGIDPDTFASRWPVRVDQYRRRWATELTRYTGNLSHFDKVLREVERALRPWL